MKKSLIAIALAGAMVFAFASTAMADHSPQFYFDDFSGNAALSGRGFQVVFPSGSITLNAALINNGAFGGTGNNMHGNYSQTTAKCGACHSVHRAPGALTSSYSTTEAVPAGTVVTQTINGLTASVGNGTAVTSSRYKETAWTAEVDTQLLLKSSAANACKYCHVADSSYSPMYGGDMTLAWVSSPNSEYSWNEFYGHTTGCTGCHAVHGANVFKATAASGSNAIDNTGRFILKYAGVKNVKTDWTADTAKIGLVLQIQPEVYGAKGLYTSLANAQNGVLAAAPLAAGVTAKAAAITAQCSMCHANYAATDATVNASLTNLMVWQPGSWASANGSKAHTTASGQAGIVYASGAPAVMMMAYKNHPMKAVDATFTGAGASAGVLGQIAVADKASWTCQSCHDAPEGEDVGSKVTGPNGKVIGPPTFSFGGYGIQVFPHYNPGYYKFMKAQNQAALDTPATYAEVNMGRIPFFVSKTQSPAIMNDGYCTKCHSKVGGDGVDHF